MSCECKKQCNSQCPCVMNNLSCTDMCSCNDCGNSAEISMSDDDDDDDNDYYTSEEEDD